MVKLYTFNLHLFNSMLVMADDIVKTASIKFILLTFVWSINGYSKFPHFSKIMTFFNLYFCC